MGVLRSELDQSSSSDAAELETRREISVLEDLRNASQGSPLTAGPIIAQAEDLARRGQAERGLDLIEVASAYRQSFGREDFDVLRLARAGMQSALGSVPRAAVEDLESLVNDEEALGDHRAEALIRLATISAVTGDFRTGSFLSPQRIDGQKSARFAPAVVLARATYLILAGEFSSALNDTNSLLDRASELTSSLVRQARIQHAWALTHSGRFTDSSNFIHASSPSEDAGSNALAYIDVWNEVGSKNLSFLDGLKRSPFTVNIDHEESDWSQLFFGACSALAKNNLDQALEIFMSLPSGPEIEPTLNGTQDELVLLGKAHTLLERGDYEAAYDTFRRLSSAVPARPGGARLQILTAAQHYGLLSAQTNSVTALEKVSAARRCAQLSLGLRSPLIPRLMDIEAELLLANGRSSEARASRVIALELIDEGEAGPVEERLSHELGLHLVDAHENKTNEALSGLRSIIPKLKKELGWHHEKTIIARYALTSLTDPNATAGTDQRAFEDLYEDLAMTVGVDHLLTLKARYGLARRLALKGKVPEALAHYTSIDVLLPDLPQNLKFKTSVQRRIGDSHRTLRQYEAAHSAYTSALESLKASISPSTRRELEIQLDIHECLVKRGLHRQAMNFFSTTASMLRESHSETTTEYFRAVHGYASCLELLHNYAGSAHNYGHLVQLLDEGIHPGGPEYRAQVYIAAAWNNELSKNFNVAASLYGKALVILKDVRTVDTDGRRVADLEHRLLCCSTRLAA